MAAHRPLQSHIPPPNTGESELRDDIGAEAPKPPLAGPVWEIEEVRGLGDREVARIAGVHKGYVVREQLLAAGIGPGAIVHRIRAGRLYVKYRGVYLVGREFVEPFGEEMAAVLYFRGHAVLSHRSAAAVWGLLPHRPGEVTLTTVIKARRSRRGLRVHRTKHLDRRDLRLREGLPVTSPPRTIVDLGADPDLEEAIAVAQMRGLASPDEIRAALDRAPGRRGARGSSDCWNPAASAATPPRRPNAGCARCCALPSSLSPSRTCR